MSVAACLLWETLPEVEGGRGGKAYSYVPASLGACHLDLASKLTAQLALEEFAATKPPSYDQELEHTHVRDA